MISRCRIRFVTYYSQLSLSSERATHIMRTTLLLSLGLVAALGACSGDTSPTSFSDPIAAMDAADSAKAAGDSTGAKAGYEYALANGDSSLQGDAMIGLFEVDIADQDEAAATSSFNRLASEFASALTQDELSRLVDMAILAKFPQQDSEYRIFAKFPDLGEVILGYAVSTFPEMKASLANAAAAVELIKTQGPEADLSGVGYAGD